MTTRAPTLITDDDANAILAHLHPGGAIVPYVQFMRQHTDDSLIHHVGSALTLLASVADSSYHITTPRATIYPNLFTVLVGGGGRGPDIVRRAGDMLRSALGAIPQGARGYAQMDGSIQASAAPGVVITTPESNEAYLSLLRHHPLHTMLLPHMGEFLAMTHGRRRNAALRTMLTDAYGGDTPSGAAVQSALPSGKTPRPSLLGAISAVELEASLDPQEWTRPFFGCGLYLYAESTCTPRALGVHATEADALAFMEQERYLAEGAMRLARHAQLKLPRTFCGFSPMVNSNEAAIMYAWGTQLERQTEHMPFPVQRIAQNATILAYKLAMLIAMDSMGPKECAQDRWALTMRELQPATMLVECGIRSGRLLFSEVEPNPGTRRIRDVLRVLQASPRPMSSGEILGRVAFDGVWQLREALDVLKERKDILSLLEYRGAETVSVFTTTARADADRSASGAPAPPPTAHGQPVYATAPSDTEYEA